MSYYEPLHDDRETRLLSSAFKLAILGILATWAYIGYNSLTYEVVPALEARAFEVAVSKCRAIAVRPGPSKDWFERKVSNRFDEGTLPVILKNARLWTGRQGGKEVMEKAKICMAGGVIRSVSNSSNGLDAACSGDDVVVYDAAGSWVTPGLVDMHSHIGVSAQPSLIGVEDGNAKAAIATHPWFRALDGLNTHDLAYNLTISGGVTSALILPGSAHAINGEGYAIKLRKPADRGILGFLLESHGLDGKVIDKEGEKGWRYLKSACGENPARVLDQSRPETAHAFRTALRKAKSIQQSQNDFCSTILQNYDKYSGNVGKAVYHSKATGILDIKTFPGDADGEWEMETLVGVLRGDVKAMTHCYEATDMAQFIRLTHEFQFPVEAFHHAHEAYDIPSLLNSSYGKPPAAAIFSLFAGYKREAYSSSRFAAKILEDSGIDVVIKSDHPGFDSRDLLRQAAEAHHFGMSWEGALSAVSTVPARRMGLDHRIGYAAKGYDADLVIWDSHPLALGATTKQVFLDGIPQLKSPMGHKKAQLKQAPPSSGSFEWHQKQAQKLGGDAADLTGIKEVVKGGSVSFINVSTVYGRDPNGRMAVLHEAGAEVLQAQSQQTPAHSPSAALTVADGYITCLGICAPLGTLIDLRGGTITPGLIAVGSSLGMGDIMMEPSTMEGPVKSLKMKSGWSETVPKAVDALSLSSKDLKLSRQAGVTRAIVSLPGTINHGLAVHFNTGAAHSLTPGAILTREVNLCVTLGHADDVPVSEQVAKLRGLLMKGLSHELEDSGDEGEVIEYFGKAAMGKLPLVVEVGKADVIATLIDLKYELVAAGGQPNLVVLGGQEAHLVAHELAMADMPVILTPVRPYPDSWDHRRSLPGPPLTKSLLDTLVSQGVRTVIGIGSTNAQAPSQWRPQELIWDAAWAQLDASETLNRAEVLAMISTDIEEILGLERSGDLMAGAKAEFVAWEGDAFEYGARVRAIGEGDQGVEIYW